MRHDAARQQVLIEIPHNAIAVLGTLAGWARWLELRLPARERAVPAWIWPACVTVVGLVLLGYRES